MGILEDHDPILDLARKFADRAAQVAEDDAFRQFYGRVGRALSEHHEKTGVRITSAGWKIVVSPELDKALKVYARRLSQKSTALEVYQDVQRIAGIDIIVDERLERDDIRLRAEIPA
jgi:hypothetical protein